MSSLLYFEDLPGRHARLETAFNRLDPSLRLPTQAIGRRYAIGCVAVEITQRCNLDCTLCYLSESSEKVKDIPLSIILARLAKVRETYGDGVGVQITGGDPTLRQRDELVTIVKEAARLGLEPSLMTNGIKLTRDLALDLKAAGMTDVAIHVDLTQERKGYDTEEALNAVRREYIERVRGVGLHVIFNTTVYAGNFHEIPKLIQFFKANADVVSLVSFQIQAATGRGVITERADEITLKNVRQKIADACETDISWDNIRVGHPDCNSVAFTLVAKNKMLDLNRDPRLYAEIIRATTDMKLARVDALGTAVRIFLWSLGQPRLVFLFLRHLAIFGARNARALWAGRGELRKLTLIIHNFMDASALVPERIDACSFMVATDQGFVSMCAHNAQRESFIRRPVEVETAEGVRVWDPLTGATVESVSRPSPASRVLPSALSSIPVPVTPHSGSSLPAHASGK
ncbi:MAG: radical SAM protein [Thermoanaerobaculia bacterium]